MIKHTETVYQNVIFKHKNVAMHLAHVPIRVIERYKLWRFLEDNVSECLNVLGLSQETAVLRHQQVY